MKKILKTLLKRILIILLGLTILAISILAITIIVADSQLPSLDAIADCRPKMPPRSNASGEIPIGKSNDEHTVCTKIENFPLDLKNAVLIAEDSRFYTYKGIALSTKNTITQQISRSFSLPSKGSLRRQFYEQLLIYKIELNFSKDQILTFYLNQVYLGQDAFGFPAASQIYFGKTVSELTLAESVILAGLPKAPTFYNPLKNPEGAKKRQMFILTKMAELGFITQAQFEQAKSEELVYQKPHQQTASLTGH